MRGSGFERPCTDRAGSAWRQWAALLEIVRACGRTRDLARVERAHVVWDSADEETQLLEINEWVVDRGLPEGEFYFEHSDPETGAPLLTIDLAWPDGLQVGLSQPIAILLNEDSETEEAANQAGYRFFTDIPSFKRYVDGEILGSIAAD